MKTTITETIKIPTKCEDGCIFAIEGVSPKMLRTGEAFEIDVFTKAERWSNGQIFAKIEGEFGFKLIDPRTVEFVAKSSN